MAYVSPNFKTKKALKSAIADGKDVQVFSVGMFPPTRNGVETVEGPHFPEPHKWYARVQVQDGKVTKVLG